MRTTEPAMIWRVSSLTIVCGLLAALPAWAQPLGSFRWQLQPFCNVVTLVVTQHGTVFEIEGTDDQCGAGRAASAAGTAFVNPDGSIGLGIAIVTAPSGTPVHLDASISPSTLSGTWHDSTGATGPFVFTPGAGNGGNPRPASTLGLSGVTLGFGLASSGSPGRVALQVDIEAVKSGLQVRTPEIDSIGMGRSALGRGAAEGSTAFGAHALASLAGGPGNTAVGAFALGSTTIGFFNTAMGFGALQFNRDGASNVAVGSAALLNNTSGDSNTAVGSEALAENGTGIFNTAVGKGALTNNRAGSRNVAVGTFAGTGRGSDNIMIGYQAGESLSNESLASNNIYIGSTGFGPDNNTIRIGNPSHAGTVIAGIATQTSAGGVPVLINAGGRMGTTTSAVRFKTDVVPLGADAGRLHALKPVRFVYKPEYDDGSRQVQFGLLAEEVAEVFPELVVLDESGKPWTVRYHLLTPLLVAEMQRLEQERAALAEELLKLNDRLNRLEQRLRIEP